MKGRTMRTLPEELRPYERVEALGAGALSDTELVAVLIKTGSRDRNATEVAQDILRRCGGITGLGAMSVAAFREIAGVGRVKAVTLLAAYELGARIARGMQVRRTRISSIEQLGNLYLREMMLRDRETFKAVLLDKKWQIIKDVTVSVGTVDRTLVHPREVFAEAVANRASAVVLMHNHPSGDATPSREDRETTRRLIQAGRVLGIQVADHIVFGNGVFYSFYREGEMEKLCQE